MTFRKGQRFYILSHDRPQQVEVIRGGRFPAYARIYRGFVDANHPTEMSAESLRTMFEHGFAADAPDALWSPEGKSSVFETEDWTEMPGGRLVGYADDNANGLSKLLVICPASGGPAGYRYVPAVVTWRSLGGMLDPISFALFG